MEKEFSRRVPCTREKTPIELPNWLRAYASGWREQGAEAVVLFGSRAQGMAQLNSDWDVAVIFNGSSDLPSYGAVDLRTVGGQEHEVNQMLKSVNEMNPALVREVLAGIELQGDFEELIKNHYEGSVWAIDRIEIVSHLAASYVQALYCISLLDELWKENDESMEMFDLYSNFSESASAEAAERGVKALCCAFGRTYAYTHDVAALAQNVPDEWREFVLSLNGSTKEKHTSSYGGTYYESGEASLDRVEGTLKLINHIVESELFIPTKHEREEFWEKVDSPSQGYRVLLEVSRVHPRCDILYRQALAQIETIRLAG